jgi:hypothetical protein
MEVAPGPGVIWHCAYCDAVMFTSYVWFMRLCMTCQMLHIRVFRCAGYRLLTVPSWETLRNQQ